MESRARIEINTEKRLENRRKPKKKLAEQREMAIIKTSSALPLKRNPRRFSNMTDTSKITLTFFPEDQKPKENLNQRLVKVSSKQTTDKKTGEKIPAPFSPFFLLLSETICSEVTQLPEVFREPVFLKLEEIVKAKAADAKKAGKESLTLENSATRLLLESGESLKFTIANIQNWFDTHVAETFSNIKDEEKRERFIKTYRLAFCKLASSSLQTDDLEKLSARLEKLSDSALEERFTELVLQRIDEQLHAETLLGMEEEEEEEEN